MTALIPGRDLAHKRAYSREWNKAHPDRYKANCLRYRHSAKGKATRNARMRRQRAQERECLSAHKAYRVQGQREYLEARRLRAYSLGKRCIECDRPITNTATRCVLHGNVREKTAKNMAAWRASWERNFGNANRANMRWAETQHGDN